MLAFPAYRAQGQRLLLRAAVLALLLSASCAQDHRKPLYPVRGQVFVQGQPARDAFVIFPPLHSTDPYPTKAFARVAADGSFRLTTYQTGDGAPAGDYAVTVWWRKVTKAGEEKGPDQLHGRYRDPQTS